MTLKQNRLRGNHTIYRTAPDSPTHGRFVYSYDGTTTLYDVVADAHLGLWYRENCRRVDVPNRYHKAIIEAYALNAPDVWTRIMALCAEPDTGARVSPDMYRYVMDERYGLRANCSAFAG